MHRNTLMSSILFAVKPAILLLEQMFSFEYCKISKKTRFEEHLHTASEVILGSDYLELSFWAVAFKTILTY